VATIVNDDYEENEVGGYNDHHMDAMFNDAFRYEENTIVVDLI